MAANKRIAGCEATTLLKLLALVFMFIDHSGKMVYGNNPTMRVLGRLAFPIYCWCMVVGVSHTRSVLKYMLRVALIGLISKPLNMVGLNHAWYEPSVFSTLVLGLAAIGCMRKNVLLSRYWVPPLVIVLAALWKVDYGWQGVLFIILLYMARDSRSSISAVMIAFCLYWGSISYAPQTLFGYPVQMIASLPYVGTILTPLLKVQALSILSLPLILLPLGRAHDLKLPRWVGYSAYPLHLVALIALEFSSGSGNAVMTRFGGLVWQPILQLLHL